MKKKNLQLVLKATFGFLIWLVGSVWLLVIDWRIGIAVLLITLSIYNDLKLMIKNKDFTI